MDGASIGAAFGSAPGPDCLKEVVEIRGVARLFPRCPETPLQKKEGLKPQLTQEKLYYNNYYFITLPHQYSHVCAFSAVFVCVRSYLCSLSFKQRRLCQQKAKG